MPQSFENQYEGGDDRAPLPNQDASRNEAPEAAPESPSIRRSHGQPTFQQSPYISPEKQEEYHRLWNSCS
jgi:hypothetical protein